MRVRLTSWLQIAVLLVLAAVLLALLSRDGLDARFQSPVSTASPSTSPVMPDIIPGDFPVLPVPERASQTGPRPFSATVWSSPLPWMAVGVVVFGGLAWALVKLLSRFDRDKRR